MSVRQEWIDFLEQRKQDFIGGEIEHTDLSRGTFRGSIADIVVEKDSLVIIADWVVRLQVNLTWKKVVSSSPGFLYAFDSPLMGVPKSIGGHRVTFGSALLDVTLFPRDGEKLDRSKVQGI